jgi:hypothetical protein
MSIFNRIIGTIGLGLVFAAIGVDARGQADSNEPSTNVAPAPGQTAVSRERYLLLTNGHLVKGVISETDTECLVQQKIGVMPFPKKRVEGTFDSIRQAYEHLLAALPDRDSDESMKLALWCLNQKLSAEARELLTSILAINPNHPKARAMLLSIDQAAARLADRERDPEVRQTRADTAMSDQKPEVLDSAVLRNAQRALGIRDLPVIFDLPMPLAIKRTEEFTRYVHPLLQAYCAKCHDAQYEGEFQLVPVKSRGDRTSNALRANLDATLRLVDPKNPSHSVLLSSTLRAHGKGARRPIFPGSNDKVYMVLARWVNQLAAPKDNEDSARGERSAGPTEIDEVFAVERNRSNALRPTKAVTADASMPAASTLDRRVGSRPAVGQPEAEPQEFPIPFAISGVKPNPALPKRSPSPTAKQSSGVTNSKVPEAKATNGRATVQVGDDDPDELPPPKSKDKTDARKRAPKTFTIDPKLLERTLQYRNANRQSQN